MDNQAKNFTNFAADYAFLEDPVVVTDKALHPIYFNPAAGVSAVFSMRADCILRIRNGRLVRAMEQCDKTGRTAYFSTYVGGKYKERFSVEIHPTEEHYAFIFHALPDQDQKIQENYMRQFGVGYDYLIRSPLQSLLTDIESMILNQENGMSSDHISPYSMNRDVLQAIRIAKQMEMLRSEPYCEVVSFEDFFDHVVRSIANHVKDHFSRQISFSTPDQATAVKCDVKLTQHILLGLICNALRYSNGDVLVKLSSTDDVATITVCDEGKGMESRRIAFGKTQRTGDLEPGAGLGLVVCRQLAYKMQGALLIQNGEGGSCFTVVLPVAHTDQTLHESALRRLNGEGSFAYDIEFSVLEPNGEEFFD